MLRALHAELQKARRRHDGAVVVGVALAILLWSGSNGGNDPGHGYTALFYTLPMMNAVMMPLAVATLASRIWDVETQGQNCKLLFTLMERGQLFWGKAALGLLENALLCALECAAVLGEGLFYRYSEPLNLPRFGWLFVCTFAVNGMLYFFMLYFSMRVQNQIAPLALGFCGALAGLFSAFLPKIVGYFIPFGYYVPLGAVAMQWNEVTRQGSYTLLPYPAWLLAVTLLLAVLCAFLCRRTIDKQEV